MGFVGVKNVFGQVGWYEQIADLARLENEYHARLDSPDPELFSPDSYDWELDYRRMSEESESFCCFVAFDGKEPVGFAAALVSKDPALSFETGHIVDVFVKDEFRHEGVGHALMVAVKRWFATFPDVRTVTLEVWKGNEDVIPFYERHGFAVRDYEMTAFNHPDFVR